MQNYIVLETNEPGALDFLEQPPVVKVPVAGQMGEMLRAVKMCLERAEECLGEQSIARKNIHKALEILRGISPVRPWLAYGSTVVAIYRSDGSEGVSRQVKRLQKQGLVGTVVYIDAPEPKKQAQQWLEASRMFLNYAKDEASASSVKMFRQLLTVSFRIDDAKIALGGER